jgi:alkylation response protein AidB-like acyl-CoA dehydrogenase
MLMPPEDELFVTDAVRRFAAAKLQDAASAWDRDAQLPDGLGAELAELGLTAMLLPEAAGGAGLGFEVALGAVRELARADASLAWVVGAHNLALSVARDVDVAPFASGAAWLTVPGPTPAGGSAVAALGPSPRWIVAEDGALIPPPAHPGPAASLGLRAAGLVAVPRAPLPTRDDSRIAGLGVAAAVALGLGEAALEAALDYAAERQQFGRPIAQFQGLQFRLADRATELEAAAALLRWSAQVPDRERASRAALLAARAARASTYDAIQVLGGVGFVREYPVERRYRDAQALEGLLIRPDNLRTEASTSPRGQPD